MKAGSRKQKQRHQLTLFPQETKVTKVFFLTLSHLPKEELEAKIPVFGLPMTLISCLTTGKSLSLSGFL